jgi:hypothetical protein
VYGWVELGVYGMSGTHLHAVESINHRRVRIQRIDRIVHGRRADECERDADGEVGHGDRHVGQAEELGQLLVRRLLLPLLLAADRLHECGTRALRKTRV